MVIVDSPSLAEVSAGGGADARLEVRVEAGSQAAAPRPRQPVAVALRSRAVPLAWSGAFLFIGLLYMFAYGPLVSHVSGWETGGDLWGIFRAAHYVGWGFVGGIYDPSTGVVTFPGMPVLLAPLAMLSGALHLTESSPDTMLSHPEAALLLQPVELLLGCSILFAVNSLAVMLDLPRKRRVALVGATMAAALPVVAVWGHAEDIVAVAFLMWALRALMSGKERSSGWLMGFGILMQPMIGLVMPIELGLSNAKRWFGLIARAVVPSAILLSIALDGNWTQTIRAVVKQPTPPAMNRATPWVSLAPRIGGGVFHYSQTLVQKVNVNHHLRFASTVLHEHSYVSVSGGPPRLIALALALLVGVFVWRKQPDVFGIVWLCAVALALRCYFEPVMTPYYLAAPFVVALVAAARINWLRFGIAFVVAAVDTVYSYHRFSPWVWGLPVAAMLTVVLACGYPGRQHLAPAPGGESTASPPEGIAVSALG